MEFVVIDACAIIKGHSLNLHRIARKMYTTTESVGELRDPRSREAYANLPFEIELKQPKQESLRAGLTELSCRFSTVSNANLSVVSS